MFKTIRTWIHRIRRYESAKQKLLMYSGKNIELENELKRLVSLLSE